MQPPPARRPLLAVAIPVQAKLAGLWASVMFCYIYGDYFSLYRPGAVRRILEGSMPPLGPVTQQVLLFTTTMMIVPSVMIALSLLLPPRVNRWTNVAAGLLYTAIILVTMWDWAFLVLLGVVEVALTLAVVVHAWRWPRPETPVTRTAVP